MDKVTLIILEMLGVKPQCVTPLDPTNNAVFEVETGESTGYFLKLFERNQYGAYERELGMRKIL